MECTEFPKTSTKLTLFPMWTASIPSTVCPYPGGGPEFSIYCWQPSYSGKEWQAAWPRSHNTRYQWLVLRKIWSHGWPWPSPDPHYRLRPWNVAGFSAWLENRDDRQIWRSFSQGPSAFTTSNRPIRYQRFWLPKSLHHRPSETWSRDAHWSADTQWQQRVLSRNTLRTRWRGLYSIGK